MISLRRILGPLLIGFGIAGLAAAVSGAAAFGVWRSWATALGGAIVFAGFGITAAAFGRDARRALWRWDCYLPFLRRAATYRDPNHPPPQPRAFVRLLLAGLPKSWRSDAPQARAGLIRRLLNRLGPSWQGVPWRRLSQTLCFLLFLALFFWVCWPYGARPARSSAGWIPVQIDPETGAATLTRAAPAEMPMARGDTLHAVDATAAGDAPAVAFRIAGVQPTELKLTPVARLAPQTLETLAFSAGPWTLHERSPDAWAAHHAEHRAGREHVEAELFLILDPLLSISTALAAKAWVWSLVWAAIILTVCLLIPRGFCGYLCPLGTLIDLFDWAIGKRVKRFRVGPDGWWVHLKYYLLLGCLVAALGGVLLTGFFAAIPVITRGMLFVVAPFVDAAALGAHQVPPLNAGQVFSIVLFFGVLGLGFLRPRFWCKYVCPTGAVFSLGNLFRLSERQVESTCVNCHKCVEVCPFDAIKEDFTTRTTDCTLCQTCAPVCPTHAIKFVDRFSRVELKVTGEPVAEATPLGRRGFLAAGLGLAAGTLGGAGCAAATRAFGANLDRPDSHRPIRPPGSVPEKEFLQMCIRCGECFKACPNHVLQPLGFEQGFEGLWTPAVKADWAGCEPSCNNCGQVCPTGAIHTLPIEQKKDTRMGLAIVDERTCLPLAGREACQLCVDECTAAGYDAIEFRRVGVKVDDQGLPIEGTGFLAPEVLDDRCVGCGLCQTRCYQINVKHKGLLEASAIVVEAGEGREDRLPPAT